LKTNSATLRALIAPYDSGVCPTSITIRNFDGSHFVATVSKSEGIKPAGPSAASFTARRFGSLPGIAKMVGLGVATRFDDLPCFEGLFATYDSQPAALTSIGRSTNAAIALMMARPRGQTFKPDPASFLPDDILFTAP
jgi:hypothetical protein